MKADKIVSHSALNRIYRALFGFQGVHHIKLLI